MAPGFGSRSAGAPRLASTVSVSNIGILLGALAAAVIGGLMMGYGARLAYGCNIGAFFSGVASKSLHGWAWIAMALLGSVIGIRLRPLFHLDGTPARDGSGH